MKDIQLDRRDEEVLEAVITAYIETGEPIGSRTISRLNREGLSPATIRNIMADLEDKRLLMHPHTSAGRVPTDLGYRVYVNSLMKTRTLPASEEHMIESKLAASQPDAGELFGSVSRLLSRLSRHMGVIVSPHIVRVRLRDIEFVKLGPHRVLVIIVAASQTIHNKVIEIEEEFDQETLDRLGRYLTETFRDHTLPEIRDRILEMMGEEKALYDTMLRDALKLGRASIEDVDADVEGGTGRVFVDGTSNLLAEPEFNSIDRLKGLFRTFEEKHELLRVLNSCLAEDAAGVRVIIGSENPSRQMSDCALVAAPYGVPGATLGTLGIIGPTRMEYARAIALVDSVARLFSNSLARAQS